MKIRIYIFGVIVFLMGSALQSLASDESIQIIKDGGTGYRVMIGPKSSPTEEFAAQELQGYAMQASEVFLPMAGKSDSPNGKLIILGSSAAAKLGLDTEEYDLGPDGFIMKTIGDRIVLTGSSPRGTLYSVYEFLEMLGCRWPAPGIIGEIIPRLPEISIEPMDHLERPSLKYRGFTSSIPQIYDGVPWIDWMGKNRMNCLMIQRSNYADFKAVLGGEIEKRSMEVGVIFDDFTSTEDEEKQVLEFIASNPEVDIIGLSAETPEGKPPGDQYLESVVRIAEAIDNQYSDRTIHLMISRITYPPPPNMQDWKSVFAFDTGSRCYRHSLDCDQCEINREIRNRLEERLKAWRNVHIYEHYMGSYGQNSLPFPILNSEASDMRYFSELGGLNGVISQCETRNWGAYGLNYYVFAKMAWDAHSDLGIVVDDYCEKYYGSAAGPMKRFFADLEDSMSAMEHFGYIDPPQLILKLFDEKMLEKLETELQNAGKLASDAMQFDRIRKLKLSLNHAKLLWHTLDHYTQALQLQEAGELKDASEHFQNAIEKGEELVTFLFQNVEEGVFIISEDYIFSYLEILIADARDRKELVGAE